MREYTYLGLVAEVVAGSGEGASEDRYAVIEQKNKFCTGDTIEIMKPDGRNIETRVLAIRNEDGEEMASAPHPKQKLFIALDQACEIFDILRVPYESFVRDHTLL